MSRHFVFVLVILCNNAAGQNSKQLIDQFRQANKSLDLAYDYKIRLKDMKIRKSVDSIVGHMACRANNYKDSCADYFMGRSGNYFYRIDHIEKTVAYQNLSGIKSKAIKDGGNAAGNVIMNISDSLVQFYGGHINVDSGNNYYRLRVSMKNFNVSYAQIDFDKKSFRLIGAYIEAIDNGAEQNSGYLTQYFLTNVRYGISEKETEVTNLFTMKGGQPVLSQRFSKYKLKSLM